MISPTSTTRSGQRANAQTVSHGSVTPIAAVAFGVASSSATTPAKPTRRKTASTSMRPAEHPERSSLVHLVDVVHGTAEGGRVARHGPQRQHGAEDEREPWVRDGEQLGERPAHRVDRRRLGDLGHEGQQAVRRTIPALHDREDRDPGERGREERERTEEGQRGRRVEPAVQHESVPGAARGGAPGSRRQRCGGWGRPGSSLIGTRAPRTPDRAAATHSAAAATSASTPGDDARRQAEHDVEDEQHGPGQGEGDGAPARASGACRRCARPCP